MKIVLYSVAHSSFGGGYERQIITLATELQKIGHDVTIVTSSITFSKKLAGFLSILYFKPRFSYPEMDKTQHELESEFKIKQKTFTSLANLAKIMQSADLIYSKNEILDLMVLKLAIKNKKIPPVICGMHTLLYIPVVEGIQSWLHNLLYSSFFYTFLISDFKAYHSINSEQASYLKNKIGSKKIYYIPNFVSFSSGINKATKKFTLLYVGRLSAQKGIDIFLKIIEKLSHQKDFSKFNFIICGAGPYEKKVLEYVKKYQVDFKGVVSQKEMQEIYALCDVYCSTSRGEAMPVSVLEAQTMGLPVIGFNIPGLREIIRNGYNGFLVEIGDMDGYIKKIALLKKYKFNSPEQINELKINSQKLQKKSFAKNVVLKQYQTMFEQVYAEKFNQK